MLNEQDIKEFVSIYKEEFGQEISDRMALRMGTSLINLMQLIYKPLNKRGDENGSKTISRKFRKMSKL